jgi:hypothetical protein
MPHNDKTPSIVKKLGLTMHPQTVLQSSKRLKYIQHCSIPPANAFGVELFQETYDLRT